jgi:NAD(P)-dependent dehydrogenase (short-subunit alcohol dehydrogenase family)
VTGENTSTPAAPDTIVLIHGLWVTPRSWEKWLERYEGRGYCVLASAYPGFEVEVEVPRLRTKDFGRIIFVSSAAGLVTDHDTADYGMGKAAVIRLSRAVAESFIGGGVTVNCIAPGATMSDWVRDAAGGRPIEELQKTVFPPDSITSLLRRFAEAEEVANLNGYLCSPAATATRDQLLRVDGGLIRTD